MDGNLYDVQRLLKMEKPDSFSAHFEQHFKYTVLCMDLRKCVPFKLVNHLKPIAEIKEFTKPTAGWNFVVVFVGSSSKMYCSELASTLMNIPE